MSTVTIKAPDIREAGFKLIGTAPYVQLRFSEKAQETIRTAQAAGGASKSKRNREAKDFDALFQQAMHQSTEGWYGIPCAAFRNACVSACKIAGFVMTRAKLSIFVEPDGFDRVDGTPLVRISGEPRRHESMCRNANGSCDLRVRAMWEKWDCVLRVRYDADVFQLNDVANLLLRVGQQVGVGEGRPDSKASCGMGWGLFRFAEEA